MLKNVIDRYRKGGLVGGTARNVGAAIGTLRNIPKEFNAGLNEEPTSEPCKLKLVKDEEPEAESTSD